MSSLEALGQGLITSTVRLGPESVVPSQARARAAPMSPALGLGAGDGAALLEDCGIHLLSKEQSRLW